MSRTIVADGGEADGGEKRGYMHAARTAPRAEAYCTHEVCTRCLLCSSSAPLFLARLLCDAPARWLARRLVGSPCSSR